jgi:hypothetical protein
MRGDRLPIYSVRAELVEALSFSFETWAEEGQPFDKLRANGGAMAALSSHPDLRLLNAELEKLPFGARLNFIHAV